MGPHFLDHLFAPQAIAVFGASERADSVGGRVYDNLRKEDFSGPIYAINPKHKQLFQQRCYPTIAAIGKPVDLAIVATPAATVPEIIHACGEQGVRAIIILSAGFSEGDSRGSALEKAVLDIARQYQMRVLGPNCLGLIRPSASLNATFSKNTAQRGRLALVSQSGALCTAVLDWAAAYRIGFSAIVSVGDAADVDFGDLLDYLAQDIETDSILLYIEGIRDARRFLSGLRVAARMKPVIVIKSGRHLEGSRAAVTHTGAMVGSDDVFDAALERAGAIRVKKIGQLFAAARLLSTTHRVHGNRLAIVTNGGGPGVMAVDHAIDLGVQLATLSEDSLTTLNDTLPMQWSHANPIDLLGDASPARYQSAVSVCLRDPGVDGLLVMLTPQAMTDTTACAKAVITAQTGQKKPVLVCWMGEKLVVQANKLFSTQHVPNFTSPESSVEAFAYLSTYYQNQQLLMQVPAPLSARSEPDVDGAKLIIEGVLSEQRSILSSTESKAVLHAFAIPVTQSIEVSSPNSALVAAESLGFPVVMKINSPDITHKSDVSGVRLNVANAQAVRGIYQELTKQVHDQIPAANIKGVTVEPMYTPAYGRELLIGVVRDPVFGPAITFGAGGTQVEVWRDRATALPPLNTFLAEKMIRATRVAQLLGPYRGIPAIKMEALIRTLRQISELVCALPQIKALDINPLMADDTGVMVLDARIVVEYKAPALDRYAHMAIHPYPSHLISYLQLADGTDLTIRPIRPEDASIEDRFVRELSSESKYFRFMNGLNELTQAMLVRFTQLDYDRELALVAVLGKESNETELGVARYVMNADGESCEFALVVADAWQGKGIGSHLMNALITAARTRGFREMNGEIIATNQHMLGLVQDLGFHIRIHPEDPNIVIAIRKL